MNIKKKKLTPRQIKALKTKERLFNCAMKLFSERGYNNVTVDEIVMKANSSKGAFYNHFSSKYELILEIYKTVDDKYVDYFKSISNVESSTEKLSSFIRECFRIRFEELDLESLKTVYSSEIAKSKNGEYMINENRQVYKIIKKIIEEGQNKEEFRSDISSTDITKMIICYMRGVFIDWCLYDGSFNLVEVGCFYLSMLIESLTLTF